ncbi:hypothetical protein LSTR_LSTR007185 [Laodelphax striatellus]|uniref:Uncharacterized protein n=1 Tax=Laodelphax striatellus TaxID=195883 RepID=A0A482WWE6_LAOST|nr:hypothetical protein LSTR_LSTR007185 [Laodelphax striatellus]
MSRATLKAATQPRSRNKTLRRAQTRAYNELSTERTSTPTSHPPTDIHSSSLILLSTPSPLSQPPFLSLISARMAANPRSHSATNSRRSAAENYLEPAASKSENYFSVFDAAL